MKTAQITKKKVITEEKKITKKGQRKKKKIACTETDGMTKMTKTPTKMAKMTKKTKQSLSLKKKHIHLIPADVVVKLVVDFLYDHNLCHAFDIGHV